MAFIVTSLVWVLSKSDYLNYNYYFTWQWHFTILESSSEAGPFPDTAIARTSTLTNVNADKLVICVTHSHEDNAVCLFVIKKMRSAVIGLLDIDVFPVYSTKTMWKIPLFKTTIKLLIVLVWAIMSRPVRNTVVAEERKYGWIIKSNMNDCLIWLNAWMMIELYAWMSAWPLKRLIAWVVDWVPERLDRLLDWMSDTINYQIEMYGKHKYIHMHTIQHNRSDVIRVRVMT